MHCGHEAERARYAIQTYFPTHLERTVFWEIHDLDCTVPEEMFPHLERAVMALIDRLDDKQAERS